jgi:hypothetical protein
MKLFSKRLNRTVDLHLDACGYDEGMRKACEQQVRLYHFVKNKLEEMAEETAMAERGRNAE